MVCQLIDTTRSKSKSNKLIRSRSESPVSSLGRQSINRIKYSLKTTATTEQIRDLLINTSNSNNKRLINQSSSCNNLSNYYLSNTSFNLNYTLKTQTSSNSHKDDLDDDDDDDDLDEDLFNFNDSTTKSHSSLSTTTTTSQSEILATSDTQSILEQNISLSTTAIVSTNETSKSVSLKRQLSSNCSAAELVSLSSLTSNYSQFDFSNNENNLNLTTTSHETKQSLSGFAAFLTRFTSNKSKIQPKTNENNDVSKVATNTGFMSGAFKLFSKSSVNEINVPNSVLIFENRPSNLPAKSEEEALKHRQEYEKMVANAKKKELKETQLKIKKNEQQLKKEDFMANSLKVWNNEIISNWNKMKNMKRTQELWWHGLPPSIRGKVWILAIGNSLNLKKEDYQLFVDKAEENIEILSRKSLNDKELDTTLTYNSSVELIKLDVSRTFPQLCFFQRNGPYHDSLHNVLGAYASYNPKIGYVQGMSFLAAILLLNMDATDAFICLANLLNNDYLMACFRMDHIRINRYFKLHQILFQFNMPKLFDHFEEQKVKPDLYLIDWVFTLFSRSLPLDVVSRVWDVYLRDKEEFLFRASLGLLNLYKDVLLQMDFINIVRFLNKLPEDTNSTKLFKSIEQMRTSIDNENSFVHLLSTIIM